MHLSSTINSKSTEISNTHRQSRHVCALFPFVSPGSNLSSLGEVGMCKNDWPKSKLRRHRRKHLNILRVVSFHSSRVIQPLLRSESGERRAKHRGWRQGRVTSSLPPWDLPSSWIPIPYTQNADFRFCACSQNLWLLPHSSH